MGVKHLALPTVKARRRNLSASIADDFLLKIRDGQLPAGSRLPTERELMEEYGVGRNTVREALQALVTMGYLDVRPRVGARVIGVPQEQTTESRSMAAHLTGQPIADIYDLRRTVETEIAYRAAKLATEEDLARIREALEAYENASVSGIDPYRADVAFHSALAHANHNVAFSNVLDAAAVVLLDARRLTDRVPGAITLALEEHRVIAEAVFQRDPKRAQRAMRTHMETSIAAWRRAERLFDGEAGSYQTSLTMVGRQDDGRAAE